MPDGAELASIAPLRPVTGKSVTLYYYQLPDECPTCHHSIKPSIFGSVFHGDEKSGRLQLLLQCPRQECEIGFIGTYMYTTHETPSSVSGYYRLVDVQPKMFQETSYGEVITNLSPNFVQIINQALKAELSGLDQLTGIGFRKALEFLIKDFASKQHPDKVEKVKSTPLGRCIDDYIDDRNVKECAKRAVWLGNDETHYVRKWTDRDIEDLKRLIKLTVNWIENVILTQEYTAEMTQS